MSERPEREDVRQQILGTLALNAVLRWESLVTVLVTAILFLFVNDISIAGLDWQPWFWLVLGGLAEGALVYSSITDPEETQEALARQFEAQYELSQIRNNVSRQRLRKAMDYRRSMLALVKKHQAAMKMELRNVVEEVNDWIAHMYDLAEHIDSFENNEIVDRDLKSVPQQIEKVQIRISRESDERVIGDLERQLKQLRQQKLNLESTKNSVKRAEIQLESTLSSLGTIYAQMSNLGASKVDSSRSQRMRLEIKDEIDSLQDTIDAMEEVQMQSLRLR
ncbi:MAG: hypothetical protein ACPG7F_15105 [Aggregatilineales bacterium]